MLEKFFAVREGELFRALSMQLNIFLIITTLLILKPTVNSLFLSNYGIECLPNAYILVALMAGIVTSLYAKIVARVSFIFLNIITLTSSVIALIFFGIALQTGIFSGWLMYLFYVWLSIFAVLTTSQFWVFVNIVFNEREFKRLVGLIGTGAIAGGIFGGYLASFLSGHLNSTMLPFVGACTIALCIPITLLIYHENRKTGKPPAIPKKDKEGGTNPIKLIRASRHLTFLAAIVGISNVVAKLVDYQFSDMASAQITDQDKLTAFFGFWFSTFNVGALVIQLFATRFLLSRFGVGYSLLLLPISILFAVITSLFAPELLIAVIAMKMADGSFKQSINKSAMELLVLPINTEVKNKTKTFIDVFVDSFAAGFSGLLLIFVIKGLSLSGSAVSALILGFSLLWILMVWNVSREYLLTFKRKIMSSLGDGNLSKKGIKKVGLINDLMNHLNHGTKPEIIRALQQIKHFENKKYNNVVINLLSHKEAEIRAEAFQYLSHYKDLKIYHQAEKLTSDSSAKVRMGAIAYLIENTPISKKEVVLKQLDHSNPEVCGMALVNLAKHLQFNPKLKEKYDLEERIIRYLEYIPEVSNGPERYAKKVYAIQAIAHANIPELYPYLQRFFNDKKTVVIRQAIQAAGLTHSGFFLKDLVQFSTKKTYSRMATQAIKEYNDCLIPVFTGFATDHPQEISIIRQLPSIAKEVKKPRTINFLFELLDYPDEMVRQNALKALSELHDKKPKLKISRPLVFEQINKIVDRFQRTLVLYHVLSQKNLADTPAILPFRKRVVALLKKQTNTHIDNIFLLLGLLYSSDNISTIQKGLKSPKVRVRNTSLEFLDNLLDPRLKQTLIPILEVGLQDCSKRKNLEKLNLEIPDNFTALEEILKDGEDLRLKIATLELVTKLNRPEYQALIQIASESTDPALALLAKKDLGDYSGSAVG